jgi:hypothetical protein
MGSRQGGWQQVWDRFREAPRRYPNLPGWLKKAKPQDHGELFLKESDEVWPQTNDMHEAALRITLKYRSRAGGGPGHLPAVAGSCGPGLPETGKEQLRGDPLEGTGQSGGSSVSGVAFVARLRPPPVDKLSQSFQRITKSRIFVTGKQ